MKSDQLNSRIFKFFRILVFIFLGFTCVYLNLQASSYCYGFDCYSSKNFVIYSIFTTVLFFISIFTFIYLKINWKRVGFALIVSTLGFILLVFAVLKLTEFLRPSPPIYSSTVTILTTSDSVFPLAWWFLDEYIIPLRIPVSLALLFTLEFFISKTQKSARNQNAP